LGTAAAATTVVENDTNEIGQCNLRSWYMRTAVEDLSSAGSRQTKTTKTVVSSDVDDLLGDSAYVRALTEAAETDSVHRTDAEHGIELGRQLDNGNASDRSPATVFYLSGRRNDWLSSPVNGCTLSVVQSATVCYYAVRCEHVCLQNVTRHDISDDNHTAGQRFTMLHSVAESDIPATTLELTGREDMEKQTFSVEMNNIVSVSIHDTSVTSNSVPGAVTDDVHADQSISLATQVANTSDIATMTNTTQHLQPTSNVDVATMNTDTGETEQTISRTNATDNSALLSAPVNTTMTTEPTEEELVKSSTSSTGTDHSSCTKQNVMSKLNTSSRFNQCDVPSNTTTKTSSNIAAFDSASRARVVSGTSGVKEIELPRNETGFTASTVVMSSSNINQCDVPNNTTTKLTPKFDVSDFAYPASAVSGPGTPSIKKLKILLLNTTGMTDSTKTLAKDSTDDGEATDAEKLKTMTDDDETSHRDVENTCEQPNSYYWAFVSRKQNERGRKLRHQINDQQTGSRETSAKDPVMKVDSADDAERVQSSADDREAGCFERPGGMTEDDATDRGGLRHDAEDWREQPNPYYKAFASRRQQEPGRQELRLPVNNMQHAVPDRPTPTVSYLSHRHDDLLSSALDECSSSSAERSFTLSYFVAMCQHVCLNNDSHVNLPCNTTTSTSSDLPHPTSLSGTRSAKEFKIFLPNETGLTESSEALAKDSAMKADTDNAAENRQRVQSLADDSKAGYSEIPGTIMEHNTSDSRTPHHGVDDMCTQTNSYYKAFVSRRQKERGRELKHLMNKQQTISNQSTPTDSYEPRRLNDSLSPLNGCLLSVNRSHTLCYFVAMCQHVCLQKLYLQDVRDVDNARRALKRLSFAESKTSPAGQQTINTLSGSRKSVTFESDEDAVTDNFRAGESDSDAAAVAKTSSTSATRNRTRKSQTSVPTPVLYVSRRRHYNRLTPIACSSPFSRSHTLCYYMYVAMCQHVCPKHDSHRHTKDDDDDARYHLINPRSVAEFETSATGFKFTERENIEKHVASTDANNRSRHEFDDKCEQRNSYHKAFVSRRQQRRGNRLSSNDTSATSGTDADAFRVDQSVSAAATADDIACNMSNYANKTQKLQTTRKCSVAATETNISSETEVAKKTNATTASDITGQPSAPVNTTATVEPTGEKMAKSRATSTVSMTDESVQVVDQHEQRLQSLEMKLLQLENQLLKSTADRGSCVTTNVELQNYVMHLERELMKRSRNLDELKTENEQLRQRNLEAATSAAVEQRKVDELNDVISNQSSLLGSLQNKFVGLEMKLLQLENKMLQSTVDRFTETTKNLELENHVMRLERELTSLNQSFVEVKSEIEQLRQRNLESLVKETNDDDDDQEQHKVDELHDIISNQSSSLGSLRDKFVGLERDNSLLIERVLNQSLMMNDVMLRVDKTTSIEPDNRHVMRLQHELATLNQSFVELNEQMRPSSLEPAAAEENDDERRHGVDELHNIINNQSTLLDTLLNTFAGLEHDNRLLAEQVLNQSLMMNEMMLHVGKLSSELQTKQTLPLKQSRGNSSDKSAATVSRSLSSPNYNMFPDPPIYKTHHRFTAKGRQYFVVYQSMHFTHYC